MSSSSSRSAEISSYSSDCSRSWSDLACVATSVTRSLGNESAEFHLRCRGTNCAKVTARNAACQPHTASFHIPTFLRDISPKEISHRLFESQGLAFGHGLEQSLLETIGPCI
jgi:hypothetical protein